MRSWSHRALNESFPFRYALKRGGFTILEVCVVLFIVAVIFVVAVPPASHLMDEEKLQRPIRELQTFARTARRNAIMENRSYEVLLLNDSYLLRPVSANRDRPAVTYGLPAGVTFAIKRLGDREFLKQTDATWVFSPSGLCEPMTFLFQRKDNWVRCRVDPLTATIQNEGSYIH
jgi:type II secretory pathway pseudopilin PulG